MRIEHHWHSSECYSAVDLALKAEVKRFAVRLLNWAQTGHANSLMDGEGKRSNTMSQNRQADRRVVLLTTDVKPAGLAADVP